MLTNLELDSKIGKVALMSLLFRNITTVINELLSQFRIITLTGPRQSGKTTLCKSMFPGFAYVNLEDISLREQVKADPKAFLTAYPDGLIIDEVHNYPDLFSYLQVIADQYPKRKFILTGSSNFNLFESITQSLAGRTALLSLMPFSFSEIRDQMRDVSTDTLLLRGFYPSVWCGGQNRRFFYQNYYSTYVERDVRKILNVSNLNLFQTFIRLTAGRVGSEFNASALSNEVGISSKTVQSWLSILSASYITFTLPPFFENLGKRLVKSPKIYFYDTGLLCYLLGIENEQQMSTHPLRGNIFENMVIAEAMKQIIHQGRIPQLYFYRDRSQNEVDLLYPKGINYEAFEIKSSQTFSTSFFDGIHYLKNLLKDRISRSAVIYAGREESLHSENEIIYYKNLSL
ncbi:MAG: ATP-binding protein [Verrucomicrobia bacterium]|nr:ATP-binding protein [Verrucomicrobiota bacterium]